MIMTKIAQGYPDQCRYCGSTELWWYESDNGADIEVRCMSCERLYHHDIHEIVDNDDLDNDGNMGIDDHYGELDPSNYHGS